MREHVKEKNNRIINEILEESGSTKKIKRELGKGKQWLNCLIDERGKRITDRTGINQIATKFLSLIHI